MTEYKTTCQVTTQDYADNVISMTPTPPEGTGWKLISAESIRYDVNTSPPTNGTQATLTVVYHWSR